MGERIELRFGFREGERAREEALNATVFIQFVHRSVRRGIFTRKLLGMENLAERREFQLLARLIKRRLENRESVRRPTFGRPYSWNGVEGKSPI